ncbi:MAG: hypothetical protein E5X38_27255 [Mesorhizobium sp.]|uniref:hypothetical protein n=1 Tax=Mesorhizobium sp. TaxID=1871066 RepID=UPI0012073CC2|nr:hypothetical protein [Mesorhizobium sp.]TIQ83933.1 MAG: hypothetical protein E5X38_27255 [Mesorhizobium sp.]
MQQQISLYLKLSEGQFADLAAVARASLAFDAAVKEIAYVLDPSLEIRLELESGTEGSLSLNSIIKTVKEKATDRKVLAAVAFTIVSWLATDIRSYVVQDLIDAIVKEDRSKSLSPEEIKAIADEVAKAIKGQVGAKQIKEVVSELDKDHAVQGVGITTNPDAKPQSILPRARFKEFISGPNETTEIKRTRTTDAEVTLTLVSPVLIKSDRKWKFSSINGEFGASVKDEDFLERVLSGREPIVMVAGISMTVTLETKEEFVDAVWVVKERNILRVHRASPAISQENLPLALEPKSNDDEQ